MINFSWLIYPQHEISSQLLFERGMDAIDSASLIEESYILDGRKMSLPEVSSEFDDDSKTSFMIEGARTNLDLMSLGAYDLDVFSICIPSDNSAEKIEMLANCVLDLDGIYFGLLVDETYYQRQNQKNPRLIDNLEGLTLVSNGESGKYERKVVDTSVNPGRFVLREGYFEAVGGLMWLKPEFFPKTKAHRETLNSIANLKIEESGDIVKLILDQNYLVNGSKDEFLVNLQNDVRAALFPESTQNV